MFILLFYVAKTKKLKNCMAAVPHIVYVCHKAQGTHIRDILEKWYHFDCYLIKNVPGSL